MIIYILRLTFFLFLSCVSVGLYHTTARVNAEMRVIQQSLMKMQTVQLDNAADSYLGFSTKRK